MSVIYEFLSFYMQLLVPSFFVYAALIHSFPLRVKKKKAYGVGFICANVLPLSDTLSLLLVGKKLVEYTVEVYWILKFLNYLTSFLVLIFFFIAVSKEWYYCYWWFMILQIILLIPMVLSYNTKFILFKGDLVYFRSFDLLALLEYILYLGISALVGILFVWISKKFISKLPVHKVKKWIWYLIYGFWAITIFQSDKVYMESSADNAYDSVKYIDNLIDFGVIMLILIYIIITVYDKRLLQLENKLLKQKSELEYESYISLQQQEEDINKLYHDIGNHMDTIKVLIHKGNTEEALNYSNTLSSKYSEIRSEYYCNNKIINAILLQKLKVCKENGIQYDYNLQIPNELSIAEIDLMSVLSNLMDNAIEACGRMKGNRQIDISISKVGDYLAVQVNNSFDSNLYKEDKNGKRTWKTNKKHHGYGVKIVKEIVERYEGKSSFEYKENNYKAMVMLKA